MEHTPFWMGLGPSSPGPTGWVLRSGPPSRACFFPRWRETKRTLTLRALGRNRLWPPGSPGRGRHLSRLGPSACCHTEARPHQSEVQKTHTGSVWPDTRFSRPRVVSRCCPGSQALVGLGLVQAAFPSRPEDTCEGDERCS